MTEELTGIGVCESCGSSDEQIARVRRYYVTPESWDTAASIVPGDEEDWCCACRTHYPHKVLDRD